MGGGGVGCCVEEFRDFNSSFGGGGEGEMLFHVYLPLPVSVAQSMSC
jgi:hypothetical protein